MKVKKTIKVGSERFAYHSKHRTVKAARTMKEELKKDKWRTVTRHKGIWHIVYKKKKKSRKLKKRKKRRRRDEISPMRLARPIVALGVTAGLVDVVSKLKK